MKIHALSEALTVCRVESYQTVDFSRPLVFIGKTDEENSLVAETEYVPQNVLAREDGWRAFRIEGVLDFCLVGILSGILNVLKDSGIGVFTVSTYNTDYILVKEERFHEALNALDEAGYEITGR
ncbi:MAG: ACT domain-containing protein [Clostridia bacterium]|nr:ACT domain-containing protein [Clostridia bacterium]